MTFEQFKSSLQDDAPPDDVSLALQAMWHDANGHWDQAHNAAQEQDDATGAWVHAYLHRVEGDEFNAGYWYRRANKPHAKTSLAEEWDEIVVALCS